MHRAVSVFSIVFRLRKYDVGMSFVIKTYHIMELLQVLLTWTIQSNEWVSI